MNNESPVSLEYIAGFFDGEGHVPKIYKTGGRSLVIVNTDIEILHKISEGLLANGIFNTIRSRKHSNEKHSVAFDLKISDIEDIKKFSLIVPIQMKPKIKKLDNLINEYYLRRENRRKKSMESSLKSIEPFLTKRSDENI